MEHVSIAIEATHGRTVATVRDARGDLSYTEWARELGAEERAIVVRLLASSYVTGAYVPWDERRPRLTAAAMRARVVAARATPGPALP